MAKGLNGGHDAGHQLVSRESRKITNQGAKSRMAE